jgi:hypothetical protein
VDLDPNALLVALAAGSLGLGIFVYGKRQGRLAHMLAGVALMVYPYFVTGWALSAGIGAGLVALLVLAVRLGA